MSECSRLPPGVKVKLNEMLLRRTFEHGSVFIKEQEDPGELHFKAFSYQHPLDTVAFAFVKVGHPTVTALSFGFAGFEWNGFTSPESQAYKDTLRVYLFQVVVEEAHRRCLPLRCHRSLMDPHYDDWKSLLGRLYSPQTIQLVDPSYYQVVPNDAYHHAQHPHH